MAAFLGLTPGAYAYRLRSGMLRSEEAMRVEMLAGALEEAVRVLRGEEEGVNWLQASIISLEGRRPVDLLVSVRGYERVKNTLTKIEYGMY
jgi:putative toxin-antitoxin system antitoxin component (TIGR02293 family)